MEKKVRHVKILARCGMLLPLVAAARQGSCDQRKKVWQEPNPENPQNYKGGGSRALDPPTRLKTHPPRPPPPIAK